MKILLGVLTKGLLGARATKEARSLLEHSTMLPFDALHSFVEVSGITRSSSIKLKVSKLIRRGKEAKNGTIQVCEMIFH